MPPSKPPPLLENKTNFEFDLVNQNNQSVIKITEYSEEWGDGEEKDELDSKSISRLNNLLSSLQIGTATTAVTSKNLMVCNIEYDKLIQANDGSGALGLIRKGESNRISGQARFHEPENLKNLVKVTAVMNAASLLVAQKHLADINERLQEIEKQLQGISAHLHNERTTKILAFKEDLERIGSIISRGDEVQERILQTLHKNASEIRPIILHIKQDFQEALGDINNFKGDDWFGTDDFRKNLTEKINKANKLQSDYTQGMHYLLMAHFLLYIKGNGSAESFQAIKDYIHELQNDNSVFSKWRQTESKISVHTKKMGSIFESGKSTKANKELINKSIKKINNSFDITIGKVNSFKNKLESINNPSILFQMENGKVIRGRYLS